MMGKLIPILLAVVGLGAGVGAGVALRPAPEEIVMAEPCDDAASEPMEDDGTSDDEAEDISRDYVKMNNQFVVPVVSDGRISALVVMSLNLEVETGQSEAIYQREPKLRDAFLQVMFDHANTGGFNGSFTASLNMDVLRNALRETAQKTVGSIVTDVLIMDIVRQDV